ncbi:MAG: hypothetical protein Q4Q06_00495 [Bacteroidota bacterium]|nr:hypothetical protein [Bacteroidota bacterium]
MVKINCMKRHNYAFSSFFLMVFVALFMVSCSDDDTQENNSKYEITTENPAVFIKDKDKLKSILTMKDIDGEGRFYEVYYTADYKLDYAINANMSNTLDLLTFVQQNLYDSLPVKSNNEISILPGCSAFAVPDSLSRSFLMGRNYDFCHTKTVNGVKSYVPITAFVLHTSPKGGKKSISFVDGLNIGFP